MKKALFIESINNSSYQEFLDALSYIETSADIADFMAGKYLLKFLIATITQEDFEDNYMKICEFYRKKTSNISHVDINEQDR